MGLTSLYFLIAEIAGFAYDSIMSTALPDLRRIIQRFETELPGQFHRYVTEGKLTIGHPDLAALLQKPVTPITDHILIINPECYIMADMAAHLKETHPHAEMIVLRYSDPELKQLHQILTALHSHKPAVVLFRNRIGLDFSQPEWCGLIDGYLEKNHIARASWFLDQPTFIQHMALQHMPATPLYHVAFHASELVNRYRHSPRLASHLLPGAARLVYNAEHPIPIPNRQLVFVGQSRVKDIRTYVQQLHAFSEPPHHVWPFENPENLRSQVHWALQHTNELWSWIQSLLSQPLSEIESYFVDYVGQLLFTALQRIVIVRNCLAHNLVVFGDTGWVEAGLIPPDQFGSLIDMTQLNYLYQHIPLHLHSNFAQVSSSICPKIFDAWASGGLVLTQATADLVCLDPKTNETIYTSTEDLHCKIEYFNSHPNERQALITHFRDLTMNANTLAHRTRTLLGRLVLT